MYCREKLAPATCWFKNHQDQAVETMFEIDAPILRSIKMNGRKSSAVIITAALVLTLCFSAGCGKYRAKKLGIPPPEHKVKIEKDVMVPVSDGTRMATDIYFPVGLDRAPVILIRTPYGKKAQRLMGRGASTERLLAQRGYIVMVQDVRGRYGSDGEFYPFIRDGQDGQDVIGWIATAALTSAPPSGSCLRAWT
jgi:predicted acyl esterase